MTYRVTVQVTTDVETDDEKDAFTMAIQKVREAVGYDENGHNGLWVTGIAHDGDGFMLYHQGHDDPRYFGERE